MKNFVITIPCRLNSKRFPQKLIKKVNNKEIFLHTYDRCLRVCSQEKIYIITDSSVIAKICKKNNVNFIKTKKNLITGSDRISSIKNKLRAKTYINVQGDEPIINPNDIKKIINYSLKFKNVTLNGYTQIDFEEAKRKSIPKVIFDKKKMLVYMSRNLIPHNYTKKNINTKYYKQVCIYAYPRHVLKFFNNKKNELEKNEDIEILRLTENSIRIKMVKLSKRSFAIDLKSDYKKLKKILYEKKN